MTSYTGKNGTNFNYNSDFSGNVVIVRKGKEFIVPGEDILEFVAYAYVMPNRIAKAEQGTWQELLGGEPR
jgi:hypothetical protein